MGTGPLAPGRLGAVKKLGRGKPFKIAITATMRKLLLLANTLLKEGREWVLTPP